jgi:hypothetical protein
VVDALFTAPPCRTGEGECDQKKRQELQKQQNVGDGELLRRLRRDSEVELPPKEEASDLDVPARARVQEGDHPGEKE